MSHPLTIDRLPPATREQQTDFRIFSALTDLLRAMNDREAQPGDLDIGLAVRRADLEAARDRIERELSNV